jgi:hypothetical protein
MVHAPSTAVQLMRLMEAALELTVQELVVLNVRVVMAVPTFHFQKLIAMDSTVALRVRLHVTEAHVSVRFVVSILLAMLAEKQL